MESYEDEDIKELRALSAKLKAEEKITPTASVVSKPDSDPEMEALSKLMKEGEVSLTRMEAELIQNVRPEDALGELMRIHYGDHGIALVRALGGMSVRQAKALMTGGLSALGELSSSYKLGGIEDLDSVRGLTHHALKKALMSRNVKVEAVVAPTKLPSTFFAKCEGKIRGKPVLDKNGIFVECEMIGRVFIPNTATMTDEHTKEMVTALVMLTGVNYKTVPIIVEQMVRSILTHMPMSLNVENKFVFSNGVAEERKVCFAKHSPRTMHDSTFAMTPMFDQLSKKFRDCLAGTPVPAGAVADPFTQIIEHIVRCNLIRKFTTLAQMYFTEFNVSECVKILADRFELYNLPALKFTKEALAKKNEGMSISVLREKTALLVLTMLARRRAFRTVGSGDKMADVVTQCHSIYQSAFAMCAKVRAVQDVFPMPIPGKKFAIIGVHEGYDRLLWRHWTSRLYDKNTSARPNLVVAPCDVEIPDMLNSALEGCAGVFFDVANDKTGRCTSAKNVLTECSYVVNLNIFKSEAAGIVAHKPEWFALKFFLPPTAYDDPPEWLRSLFPFYEVRYVKGGKMHSDEIYAVGRRSKAPPLEDNLKLYEMGMFRNACYIELGNEAIDYSLACGQIVPYFTPENVIAQKKLMSEDLPFIRAGGTVATANLLPGQFAKEFDLVEFEKRLDSLAEFQPGVAAKMLDAIQGVPEVKLTFVSADPYKDDKEVELVVRYFLCPNLIVADDLAHVKSMLDTAEPVAVGKVEEAKRRVGELESKPMYQGVVRVLSGDPTATEADFQANAYLEGSSSLLDIAILAHARKLAKIIERQRAAKK